MKTSNKVRSIRSAAEISTGTAVSTRQLDGNTCLDIALEAEAVLGVVELMASALERGELQAFDNLTREGARGALWGAGQACRRIVGLVQESAS